MAIPPTTGATATQPVPVQPGNTGAILQLPPSLATLQVGDVLEGLVAARLPNSAVTIETAAGPIILRTGLPLPRNATVFLQITSTGNQAAVAITTQPSAGVPAPPLPGDAVTATNPYTAAVNAITATVTRTLTSIQSETTPLALRQAAPSPAAAGSLSASSGPLVPASLPTGTKLPVRIVSVVPPSAAGSAASPMAKAGNAATAATGKAATSGVAAPAATGSLSGAKSPTLSSQIPGTTTAAATRATSATAFSATVMGTNVVGQAVIRAGTLELTLPAGRPLPTGGTLFLERAGTPILPVVSDTAPQTLAVAQRWEAMAQALNRSSSPGINAALQHLVPQPNAQLAGALLFFMAALRGGDPRSWLGGDIARQMDQDGFLGRIGEEFGLMQRLATEPAGQDWRLFLIPLLSDGQLHQLRLFVRGKNGGSGGAEDPAGVRFVIEASFSRLGPFQFDGLVQARNMNLVIRTEHALTEKIQRDIMEIYGTSLLALGLTGHVEFRTEQFFEVQPLAESGLVGSPEVVA